MKPSAVLLIDLENFFLSRVQYFNQKGIAPTNRPSFADDFERLITFAQRMAGGPFAVRRAYADYATLRAGPRDLMRQGVEPVQVFRLSGSKNAADMRMAMDAAALLNGAGQIDHFILVTGDGDFIPVILELKRHGHTVSVIGVTGATNELLQRFVDNFELYEDLLAAEEVEARTGAVEQTADSLAHVAACVRKLLAQKGSLRFAAVKPLLSKELGHPFDPGAFGCDTTGEFLQKYQTELGVVIRQTQHDKELDLPSATVAPPVNGTNGSKVGPKPPARAAERAADKPAPKPSGPEHHTPIHYMQLLTGRGQAASAVGTVRVPAVTWAAIAWAADTLAVVLAPPRGEPTHTTKLLPKLVTASDKSDIPDLVKQLRAIYPILRAGLGAQPPDGVYALPEGATGEAVRRGIFQYIGYVLKCRLADTGVAGEARPDVLAAVFDPGADLERATAEIAAALAEPPPAEPAPEPAPVAQPKPRPVPASEDHHTATTYAKLLKAGGAKGSDTESYKVLPVPWPSVERVCTDLVPLMAALEAPLGRDQLTARVIEAGREAYIERYDQHVRRAMAIFRTAGHLTETDGVCALNADVTSGHELRNLALAFLLQLLQLRLEELSDFEPIRAREFASAIEAGPLTDELVKEIEPAIAWMYRPADGAPPSAPEPVPAPAAPDSGVFVIEEERVPAAPEAPPFLPQAESDYEYEFDGALPGMPDPVPVAEPDPLPLAGAESPSGSMGVVNVERITSEAVAAAGEPPPAVPVPDAEPALAPDDEFALAVPVADWLTEGDPLGAEVEPLPEEPATAERLVESAPLAARVGPTPPPLPVAKIMPPPLPPPLPLSPPSEPV